MWDFNSNSSNTWYGDMKHIFTNLDMITVYENGHLCNGNKLKDAIERLKNIEMDTWKRHVVTQPKRRTYRMYKHDLCTEEYVKMNLTGTTRSFIAQFRIGILPLHIETGRFVETKPEDRICFICNMEPETEIHFMFKCPLYMHFRNHWLQKVINLYPTFSNFLIEWKLQLVLSDRRLIINTGNFIR